MKADSTHFCQASILSVWLGCVRKFVAARTVNVGELRLSGLSFGCIVGRRSKSLQPRRTVLSPQAQGEVVVGITDLVGWW